MKRVVVVADETSVGAPLCSGLEAAGFDSVRCWGPRPPDYVCGGAACGSCALAERADAIVLDGWLASDAARTGVPSQHLLLMYRSMGVPVVALEGPNSFPGPLDDSGVTFLSRDASPEEVAHAVSDLLEGSAA